VDAGYFTFHGSSATIVSFHLRHDMTRWSNIRTI